MPVGLLSVGERQIADLFSPDLEGLIDPELLPDVAFGAATFSGDGTLEMPSLISLNGEGTLSPFNTSVDLLGAASFTGEGILTAGASGVDGLARVGAAKYTHSDAGSFSAIYNQTPTAGNLLVMGILALSNDATPTCTTPTGWTAGPTGGTSSGGGSVYVLSIFLFWKVAAGSDANPAITVSSLTGVIIEEWSGLTATPYDVNSTVGTNAQYSTASGTCDSGPLTTTNASDLIWTFLGAYESPPARTLTWGGGSTVDAYQDDTFADLMELGTATRIATSTGTYTPTLALASGSGIWAASAAASMAFKRKAAAFQAVSLGGEGTLAVSLSGSVDLGGSGSLDATGVLATIGVSTLSGGGTLTAVRASIGWFRTCALSGAGTLGTTRSPGHTATCTLSGGGTLVAVSVRYVRNVGTGSFIMAQTDVSCSAIETTAVPAQHTLVCWVAADNLTGTTPTVSSISKPTNETASWVKLVANTSYSGTAGAGSVGELWAIKTEVQWDVGYVITATWSSASTVVKTIIVSEFSGVSDTLRGTVGTYYSGYTTGSCSTSGTALVAGDLVLGGAEQGYYTALSVDADTTNGSWHPGTQATGYVSNSILSLYALLQHKIITATGAQTFNPTGYSSYPGMVVAALIPSEDHGGTCDLDSEGSLTAATTPAITGSTCDLSGEGSLETINVTTLGTVSLSGEGTLSPANADVDLLGAATLSGFGTLGVVGIPAITGTVSLSGDSDLDIDASSDHYADADDLAGEGTLAVGGVPAVTGTAALGGEGHLDTIGTAFGTADLTGAGDLTAGGAPAITGGVSTFTGEGVLDVAALAGLFGDCALSGPGSLTFTGAPAISGVATMSGSGSLGVSGVAEYAGIEVAALSGSGELVVTGVEHPAGLSGGGSLTLTAILEATQPLVLSGSGGLSVGGAPFIVAVVDLSGSGLLVAIGHLPPPVVALSGSPEERTWNGTSLRGERSGGPGERDWWGESLRRNRDGASDDREWEGVT